MRLLDDPNWTGFALTEVIEPRSAVNSVYVAARYVTKRKGMRAGNASSVTRTFRIDEPQGEGLLIYRRGKGLPEVLYFVESRWANWNRRIRLTWNRAKPMAVWLLDRVAAGLIGFGVGGGMDKLFSVVGRSLTTRLDQQLNWIGTAELRGTVNHDSGLHVGDSLPVSTAWKVCVPFLSKD